MLLIENRGLLFVIAYIVALVVPNDSKHTKPRRWPRTPSFKNEYSIRCWSFIIK